LASRETATSTPQPECIRIPRTVRFTPGTSREILRQVYRLMWERARCPVE
jgi:hypothetical protein